MEEQSQSDGKFDPRRLIAEPGFKAHWREGMSDEEYHADLTAIGSSSIRAATRSLKEFYWGFVQGKEKPETKDMLLGKKIHLAVLEPEKFRSLYIVEPEFWGHDSKGKWSNHPNVKEVKEKREAWYADLPKDSVVVTTDELETITGIAKAIMDYPDAVDLIKGAIPEMAGYYVDPKTGLRMKIKPDLTIIGNVAIITDLKSTVSAERRRFGGITFNQEKRYDIQLFQYGEGVKQITGLDVPQVHVIAVEKKGAFEVGVYWFERADLQQAESDYHNALSRIRAAIDNNVWPQRQMSMERIHTPKFFEAENVDNDEYALAKSEGEEHAS